MLPPAIMNALEAFRVALQELSGRHARELPRKLAEIEQRWQSVLERGADREGLASVQRLAHGLDVASSMLGLPSLSWPARRLDRALNLLLGRRPGLTTEDVARIETLMRDLRTAAGLLGDDEIQVQGKQHPPGGQGADCPPPSSAPPAPDAEQDLALPDPPGRPVRLAVVETAPPPSADRFVMPPEPTEVESESGASPGPTPVAYTAPRRLLYVLEADREVSSGLADQLARFGYDSVVVESNAELLQLAGTQAPYAMLIDVDLAGDGFQTAQALSAMGHRDLSRVPLLYLSSRTDLNARLESVRAGTVAYFLKPVRVAELVDKLDALAARETPEPYRIMIIDADRDRANLCEAILHEVGMEVSVVDVPSELVIRLGDFNPEILLISLALPGCGGDEVAQVVHQIPSYVSMPVVFLSEQWNLDRQIGLMNMGGDALLPLPLQASQLISTVVAKVERSRTLSKLMQQDSLTGLLNHSRLQQYLEIESLRAVRQSHPLAFSMIDLDHFKAINDQFGHPVGDRVLKNLGRFLRQQLRKSDIIGRYGGEEFAVILTDTDGPSALAVMEKLCADFSRLEHDIEGATLTVTFSAGIASMTLKESSRELLLAADKALYAAKRAGRNRVMIWEGETTAR